MGCNILNYPPDFSTWHVERHQEQVDNTNLANKHLQTSLEQI